MRRSASASFSVRLTPRRRWATPRIRSRSCGVIAVLSVPLLVVPWDTFRSRQVVAILRLPPAALAALQQAVGLGGAPAAGRVVGEVGRRLILPGLQDRRDEPPLGVHLLR